ncbi:transcription termination/antitermination protein NusG [Corynebacterium sp. HMSC05H05]|uniref:transcription termination/antitermination protein NusG n=1 Tax=unclassified Corynebacterium TaxID=2624378 RepID=UPI0008A57A3D|nr:MULTISPECIES: transcription termination/antitermination protein NusG [unclassified Corynebacterium]OFT57750.1 transcription termination/antitermination protein NusG [Corynebacterium sp. HMSC05H05]OHR21431.1 transcription termination/antitermination protein NusG [Corynebacterium sp. HMSC034A01]
MTEANKDVEGAIENNEQEMIDEGAPVQPSTDPVLGGGDDDPAGTEGGDSSDEESDSSGEADAADADVAGAELSDAEVQDAVDAEADDAGTATDADGAVEEPVQETDLNNVEAAAGEGEADADADSDSEYRRRLREYTRELKKQPGDWYIIQSYSGYENKVKTNLEMRSQTLEVEDSIYEVVVPIEQAIENKDGKKKLVKRKLLPGYVLVRMDMNDAAWSVVRETPGVTSFVGNEGNATPVKHRDVAKFLLPKSAATGAKPEVNAEGETVVAMPEEEAPKKLAHDYKVGEAVTILSGALASVSATINAIDPETGKIEALVSIFGRETPVELTADQIERIM